MAKREAQDSNQGDPNQGVLLESSVRPQDRVLDQEEPELPDNWEDILNTGGAPPQTRTPEPDDDSDDESDSGDDPRRKLELENAQLKAYLAAHFRQQQGQPGNQPAKPQSLDQLVDGFFEKKGYTDVPEETRGFFKEIFAEVLPAYVAPLQNAVGSVLQNTQNRDSRDVLADFERGLDQTMSEAGLSDAEKEVFRSAVEMQGIRQFKNEFDLPKAQRLFKKMWGEYRQAGVQRDRDYVDGKVRERDTAPPRTERGSNASGLEDVTRMIHRSSRKEDDFGGSRWRKLVRSKTQRAAS